VVGKPEGKKPLGRPRSRWIENIKMGLIEIRLGGVDWIGLDFIKCPEPIEWLHNWWPLE
jgi:hypothetical protein